jgi:hypothetical protein
MIPMPLLDEAVRRVLLMPRQQDRPDALGLEAKQIAAAFGLDYREVLWSLATYRLPEDEKKEPKFTPKVERAPRRRGGARDKVYTPPDQGDLFGSNK